jgi:hypothetical protein
MDPFWLRIVASFTVAGVWIGAATIVSERCGSKVGGLIVNLPSNIVTSFIFITLTQSLAFTASAARAVPVGMAINNFVMLLFMLGVRRGIGGATALAFAGWIAMVLLAHTAGLPGWKLGSLLFLISVIVVFFLMERGLGLRTQSPRRVRYSAAQVASRMVFAGSVVAVSVILAHSAGPYWAGLFSTFPAVMMSTLVILSLAQGPAFAGGVAKILVLSSANILAFALVAEVAYPRVGLLAGTVLAYGAAVLWVVLLRPLVAKIS